MLATRRCIDVVSAAVDGITAIGSEVDLGVQVRYCPGFDVAKLLEHTGGFCRIVEGRVARDEEWKPRTGTWQVAPAEDVDGDPVRFHATWGAQLVSSLTAVVPQEPVVTWAGRRTRYFWFRRAVHELSIHACDAADAAGRVWHIDNDVALDGIDEMLGEFGDRAATTLAADGDTYHLVDADTGASFTFIARPDHLQLNAHVEPDVVMRAPASTLVRFLWGRAGVGELQIDGDTELVDRWASRVHI